MTGFTNFLLGMQTPGAAGGAYGVEAIALTDAPEGGVCKPTGRTTTLDARST
jgi:hypothetical protein